MPDIQARPNVPGPIGGARATPETFGAGVARETQQLGQVLGGVGERVAAHAEQKALWNADLNLAENNTKWVEYMVQSQKSAAPGAPGFVENFKSEWDAKAETFLNNTAGSPEIQARVKQSLAKSYKEFLGEAILFEAQASSEYGALRLNSILDSNKNIVRSNPDHLAAIEKESLGLVANTPYLNSTTRTELGLEVRKSLHDSALDGYVSKITTNANKLTPYQVQLAIDNVKNPEGKWSKNTSPDEYSKALDTLEKTKKFVENKDVRYKVDGFNQAMDQMEYTGKTNPTYSPDWIANNIADADLRNTMLKRYDVAKAVGQEAAWVKDASEPEIEFRRAEIENSLRNGPSSEFGKQSRVAKAFDQAVTNRKQEYTKDPVQYALAQSEVARDAFTRLDGSPEAASDYAETIKQEQQQLNPFGITRILTKGQSANFAELMRQVNLSDTGPDDAIAIMQQWSNQWGKYWPEVVRDLRNDGAMNATQYVASNMMVRPETVSTAKDLLRASKVTLKDIKNLAPSGSLDATKKAVSQSLQNFYDTTISDVDGDATYKDYHEAITQLVLYKSTQSGIDQSSKAIDYAKQIILDDFNFADTYRIPIAVPESSVKGAANELIRNIDQFDIVLPSLYGISEQEGLDRYLATLRTDSRWVNSSDNAGLSLTDIQGNQVWHRNINGKVVPLEYTWNEIIDLGYAPLAEENLKGQESILAQQYKELTQ